MPQSDSSKKVKSPWHLWVTGIISLLWNAMGAMDFVLTQMRNKAYMSSFTAEQLSFFYGFPGWVVLAWAIAVWGSVAGSILLLFRKSLAEWIFLFSLIAMLLTTFHNFILSNGLQVIGDTFSLVFSGIIFLVALFLYVYANFLKKQGIIN